ncbi:lanthionine synthetase C family protein [Streptomyces sp. XM4011]|uniref:lanthionine synthetase C family protein n=1 Tax=Streptomyces sp. XM4011 TaxID=2929780 RepID=UPI001FF83991|nr:lanthionine synthetase C family protein [Streptomyces sp. XM4011]
MTDPSPAPPSLVSGAAGTALLYVERAHRGLDDWRTVHDRVRRATTADIVADDAAGLFHGLPAVTFVLHAAGRYPPALNTLDPHLVRLAHRRAAAAMARIERGEPATFREYDIFTGLTGIGALLLLRNPGGSALEAVLRYLVALTRPLRVAGLAVPGWWVGHDPRSRTAGRYAEGHANLGAAHGVCGPLALLSLAWSAGARVPGQREAIGAILDWLDSWRQEAEEGPWWPEHLTLDQLRSGRPAQRGPARPSWCYGTPGIARAGQLAARALREPDRQRGYENALARCLADDHQLDRIADTGLCHGWAGLYQTAWRAAADATTPAIDASLPRIADRLRDQSRRRGPDQGFLTGGAGTALALLTATTNRAPLSGWDACLLIT